MAELMIRPDEIRAALDSFVASFTPGTTSREEVGTVVTSGDGIARVEGLPSAMANELLEFSNGVRVESGDLLFGDVDGVVAIPRAAEEEAVRRALEKVRAESMVAKKIREGMPTREVWDRYGVM